MSFLRCIVLLAVLLAPAAVSAQDLTASAPASRSTADVGLLMGLPAALATGQTTGIAAGIGSNGAIGWGLRASWSTATEYTLTRAVTDSETRVRALVSFRRSAGRGAFVLRLGAGATLVHETRERDQAARLGAAAGLTESAWAALPGGELEVGATVRVAGDWGVAVMGGPSAHLVDGVVQPGWISSLGIAWLP